MSKYDEKYEKPQKKKPERAPGIYSSVHQKHMETRWHDAYMISLILDQGYKPRLLWYIYILITLFRKN